jgi:tRNA (cmo5U34)-methyltransferase
MNGRDNATPFPAARYDAHVERTIPYYASFHEETFQLVGTIASAPAVWLDTGCGTGNLVEKALPLFPTTHFLLADPSTAMLDQARAKLAGAGPGRVTFLDATGSRDLAPGPVRCDVITAIQCHHYLDHEGRRAAVGACYRLLAEGGLFVCFENIRPMSARAVEIGKEYWKGYQVRQGKPRDEAAAHIERFDREFFPLTVTEHLDLLRESGFQTAELFWYSYMQAGFYAIR